MPRYDLLTGKQSKAKRKSFASSTKKAALIKSGGKCMCCHRKLDPRATEFDHKDNNPLNNSPSNCMVVCSNCHRKHTVIKKRKVKDVWGNVRYKLIKKKVGYKKVAKKKKRKSSKSQYTTIIDPLTGRRIRIKKQKNQLW